MDSSHTWVAHQRRIPTVDRCTATSPLRPSRRGQTAVPMETARVGHPGLPTMEVTLSRRVASQRRSAMERQAVLQQTGAGIIHSREASRTAEAASEARARPSDRVQAAFRRRAGSPHRRRLSNSQTVGAAHRQAHGSVARRTALSGLSLTVHTRCQRAALKRRLKEMLSCVLQQDGR